MPKWLLPLILVLCSCRTLTTVSYTLEAEALAPDSSLNIVLISDLHSTIYGKDQSPLIDAVTELRPDLILLSGDIVDDIAPITGTVLLLTGIYGLAPIYYVTGNHEYMSYNIDGIREELISLGVVILSDSYEVLEIKGNRILVAGVEDPARRLFEDPGYDQALSMREAFGSLGEESAYKILIAHHPENIGAYCEYPFDLVVSGHAHGGQVRIPPVLNGLYAPNQGLFPKYAGGLYVHGNLSHIVSRGLSVNRIPRIFNPPELVFITVKPTETPVETPPVEDFLLLNYTSWDDI
jgi:predicted MPP superfamily phosphohydrolase